MRSMPRTTWRSIPNRLTFLGWLAGRTELAIGTHVLCGPLHTPVQIARHATTLSSLTSQPFRLGLGAGWRASDLAAAEAPEQVGQRVEEFCSAIAALDAILGRQALHGERATDAAQATTDDRRAVDERRDPGKPRGFGPPIAPSGEIELAIGASRTRMLRHAALAADVVAIAPSLGDTPSGLGASSDLSRASLERKLSVVHETHPRRSVAVSVYVPVIRRGNPVDHVRGDGEDGRRRCR